MKKNKDNPNEEYFAAKITEKAIKLEEAGTYNALQFRKNDWIVLYSGMSLSQQ